MAKQTVAQKSSNPLLTKGVPTYGRSKAYHRSGKWAIKNKVKGTVPTAPEAFKTKTFGKSTRRVPVAKASRYYPTEEDVGRHAYVRKPARAPKVRSSLSRGTVAILLAGRFRGRRVVVLDVLPSGLLLITGPYKVNGVPLRRVNPAYVIATSTKVELPGTVDAKFNDAYFARPAKKSPAVKEGEKKQISDDRKSDQKAVDGPVIEALKQTPLLPAYLAARFSLKNGQYPHELKF